jgi:hypothetical protein
MLSFERHSDKDVQVVNIYKDAQELKPHGEIYYVGRHKGKSLIDHDDHRSVLAGDELFLKKKFTLSETEYAHLLKLAADNSELDPDTDRSIKRAYLEIKTRLQSKMRREIVFDESDAIHLRINYDTTKPKTNMICSFFGSSGSGKSYGVCQMILRDPALELYERIYLIGTVGEEDMSYEPLRASHPEKFEFINTSDLTAEDLKVSQYKHCCIVLDDIDSEPEPKTRKAVQLFRDRLLQTARHFSIRTVLTAHRFNSYRETSKMRNSSKYLTIFPRSIQHTLVQVLEKEYQYSSKDAMRLVRQCKRDGRATTIRRQHPALLMTPKRVVLL